MSSPDEGSGRRRFLQFSMAALASASAPGGVWAFQKILAIDDPLKHYPYRSWEDLYRKEWTWDSVGFTTHSNGCVGGCAWKVYVKNGVPMREEQVSEYPQLPGIPDMNPRGCQKGAVYCSWVKQPDFLKYPLKRVGERGERKWKRISWDEALTEIADKMIDTTLQRGPGNICIPKRPFAVISNTGYTRLANLLGGIKPDVSSMTGDLYPGIQTVRMPARTVSTFDDWFTSDLILMWHKNPIVTRIPDAHFLMEARYNGARLVNISADYNPSSIHADLFVPVKMGTDSHLAAAIVHELIAGKHYKADYLKEQTDLPFLVRKDNGKFLREKDFKADGKEDVFYVWDTKTGKAVPAPGSMGSKDKTLRLGAVDPALEGTFTVTGQAAKGVFTGEFKSASRTEAFEMKRVILSSPTLGMKPEGATVLLDGAKETFQNKWIIQPRWMTQSDGSIQTTGSSIVTKDSFGSVELHVEFMTPYMPNDRGQARGNSGVYVAGRYEVQVLDSFADKPANNLCGGIYQIATPIASACLPPLEWQTYDITYRAPKFDSENKKTQNAEITVKLNGTVIHDHLILPKITPGGVSMLEGASGPLLLQDHGDQVKFRNAWIKPLD